LIDSGSQNTIILEEFDQLLKLPKIRSSTEISKHKINLSIKRNNFQKTIKVELLIFPKLLRSLPVNTVYVDKSKWEKYNLADPDVNKPVV